MIYKDSLSPVNRATLNRRITALIHQEEIADRRAILLEAIGDGCNIAIGALVGIALAPTGIGKYKFSGFLEPDLAIVLAFTVPDLEAVRDRLTHVANALLESHGITRFSVADAGARVGFVYQVGDRAWVSEVVEAV